MLILRDYLVVILCLLFRRIQSFYQDTIGLDSGFLISLLCSYSVGLQRKIESTFVPHLFHIICMLLQLLVNLETGSH